MKISIIGTGYVGLITGVCLADKGHEIICVDNDKEKVNMINNKQPPIYEPGLKELLERVIGKGSFTATQNLQWAVENTKVTIVAVGTPFGEQKIDLMYIDEVSKEIGLVLRKKEQYHVVCIKSTVVPTTTDTHIAKIIEGHSTKQVGDFGLCMNPEFLREGNAIEDFMNPDRIIIGADSKRSFNVMKDLYSVLPNTHILETNLRTAEMIKYASNSFLANLISFSNDLANIAETVNDIDIKDVLTGVHLDKRLNPKHNGNLVNPPILSYLAAGCGFGGSCLPKDVKSLVAFSKDHGYDPKMIRSIIEINERQPVKFIERIENELGELNGKKIVVLGLAFKPDTDDMRESPSIQIIQQLVKRQADIIVCDPLAIDNAKNIWLKDFDITYSEDYRRALKDADACILVTKWKEYKHMKPKDLIQSMKRPILFDGRRVYDKDKFKNEGVTYFGIGLTEK